MGVGPQWPWGEDVQETLVLWGGGGCRTPKPNGGGVGDAEPPKLHGCWAPDPMDVGWRWVQDPNGCKVEVGAEALWLWGEGVQDPNPNG